MGGRDRDGTELEGGLKERKGRRLKEVKKSEASHVFFFTLSFFFWDVRLANRRLQHLSPPVDNCKYTLHQPHSLNSTMPYD